MKMGIFQTWCKDTSGDTSHEQSVCSLDVVPVTYYLITDQMMIIFWITALTKVKNMTRAFV